MGEPCENKDKFYQMNKDIAKLFEFHDEKLEKFHAMEKRQIEIQGDVSHIKGRIDNGMSTSINSIKTSMNKLEPVISHHATIIRKIEDSGWLLSRMFIVSLLGLLAWAISNGLKL